MKTAWHGSIGLWLILHHDASLSRKREILFVAAIHQGPVALAPLDRNLGKEEYNRAVPITNALLDGVGVV